MDSTKWLDYMDKFSDYLVETRKEMGERPNWDEFFMLTAILLGKLRGTCDRGFAGCVIAKGNQILTAGYAGAAKGLAHCDEAGHEMVTITREDGSSTSHCVRGVHAEQNAILQAAKEGISLEGSTLYVSMTPCDVCAKLIINAGIKRVVVLKKYHASRVAEADFKRLGIEMIVLDGTPQKYENE